MKKIELAKTAGFCFGVNRAVEMTYELVNSGKKVSTLGPLIHNPVVIEDLEKKRRPRSEISRTGGKRLYRCS